MVHIPSSLYTGLTITQSLPLKVFDSTIRPILAYGSEVWSAEFLKLISQPNLVDKAPFETVNNKFCKYIAGMPRRASHFAIKVCTLKGAYESELEIHKSEDT